MLVSLRLSAVIRLLVGRSATLPLARLEGLNAAPRDKARNILILGTRVEDLVMRVKGDA
jgi:hypothetical protein